MDRRIEIRKTKQMGRGVFALEDIQPGEKLLKLQRSKYLTYSILAQHPFFGRLQQLTNVNKKAHFAFYMAFVQRYQHEQRSFGRKVIPYINNLPTHIQSLICWNESQLTKIMDKNLVSKVILKRNSLKQDFEQVKKFLVQNKEQFHILNYRSNSESEDQEENMIQKSKQFNNESAETQPEESWEVDNKEYRLMCKSVGFQQFLKFYSAIESRSIYDYNFNDSYSQVGALIPLLQMFNHCPQGQVKNEVYFLETIKPIKKGEQIFISYGEKDNQKLFLEYGFVIDEQFQKIKNDYEYTIQKKQNNWNGLEKELSNQKGQIQNQGSFKQQTVSQQRARLAERYNRYFLKQFPNVQNGQNVSQT